jgi:hypothetical protein
MMQTLKYLLIFSCALFINSAIGQQYGNEWIDYGQTYYRFEIYNTGLYRIEQTDLVNAGIPVGSFSSDNVQIFGKEREVPLLINDGGDNTLDPGDYILFYAEGNDGWLDSTLYLDPNTIANPAYSLYNDTINYFFTWNNSSSNLRYQVETDVNYAAFSSIAPYLLFTSEKNHNNAYHDGFKNTLVSSTFYTAGKGWGAPAVNGAGNYTASLNLSTPSPYTGPGAPNATFHGKSISASNANYTGSGNHHLQWTVGTSQSVLLDSIFIGHQQITCDEDFSSSILSNGTNPVQWKIVGDQGAATDYQAYNYYAIEYPRLPDFGGANSIEFKVVNDPQGKIRLDISNAGYANPIMFVHGDTPRLVPFQPNGGVHSALIPNSTNGVDQTVIYNDLSLANNVLSFIAVNGTGTFTDFSSQLIDSALIFVYHESLQSGTQAYESYRSSVAGGGHNVLSANIDELYLQYGGGIEKHINGIRRFVHHIYNSASQKPSGLFLIGKGIREANYNETTSDGPGTRKDPTRFIQNLVPSFGHPSSDVAITSGLNGGLQWTPLVPTGRISARTNTELVDYLDKVITFESEQDPLSVYNSPNKDWQKHIIHFAGGSDANEQTQFQNYLNGWEDIIEDSLFGGYVHRVFNSSSDPLNPAALQDVTDRIADGVSLMSYFGHASATNSGFEINLDEAVNWGNNGKYPVMLVNSCYNGNIFQQSNSKSEEFVQVANLGAIAYIASVSVGVDVYLNYYSQELYRQFGYKNYGANLGTLMQKDIEYHETLYSNNLVFESTCTQMVLNGDPMLKINPHEKPEIELLPEYVSFSPTDIDLTVDSITMNIAVKNLGQSVQDTINLEVTRNFPNSSVDSVYTFAINRLHYVDTISFKMPLQANIGLGLNQFTVRVDLPSIVDEQYDETNNNQITRTLFIAVDGIIPVVPYEFAVVPDDSVTVKGSTIDPIADFNTYRFEIDTTDLFNSPEHRYAVVIGLGGVKEVNPSQWLSVATGMSDPLVCEDSMVYFWRCAIDSATPDWRESSFQYINGREGWGQDHFFQFKKNGFSNVDYDRPTRKRYFSPVSGTIECNAGSSTSSPNIYYDNDFSINDVPQTYGVGVGLSAKLHVAVMDPCTLQPWGTKFTDANGTQNPNHDFGNFNNEQLWVWNDFHFLQSDPTQLANFQNMVLNEVPDGHYLLIYVPIGARYDQWDALDSANMYNTFAALGSDSIIAGRPNRPFAFFCKKGDPSSVIEELAEFDGGSVKLEAIMDGCDDEGTETSTIIGPAASWGNVYWRQNPEESPTSDSTTLRIKGYNQFGVLSVTIDTLYTLNDSIMNLNSFIDASQYPYLQLEARYIDTVDYSPAQVDSWHVLFSPLPEAAIDGSSGYYWSYAGDTLEEGHTVDFAVDIRNIFSVDMDSLLVSYWVEDANQVKHPISYPRQDSLRVGEVLRDTITIDTYGLGGINSLWVEANPYINGSLIVTDQPEQEHFNNLLQLPFFVNPDDKNPILDVTFNGQHILNGDIVDPNSEVLITLKDDNEFLIMDNVSDTSLFGIYLTDPLGVQRKIHFVDGSGQTVMQWIPAEPQHKRFKIIWPTEFTMDGTYTLFVQGTDRSGNLSGDMEYRVSFEVIRESSITHMMNYPNPFSTSTRFVFTLTGTEPPDDIIIQIMTVSGRVVREITEDQLGPIQIGRNITEYAWDGTDEFGDPLANGVYLYRVQARINGEEIKHRESGADQYFEKSFGKMYLMR